MYTGIASVAPADQGAHARGLHRPQPSGSSTPLAASYIEKLSLFVEGYQIGLAGL